MFCLGGDAIAVNPPSNVHLSIQIPLADAVLLLTGFFRSLLD